MKEASRRVPAVDIYVVDNPSLLEIVSLCLTENGLSHSTFTDTADALRAFQSTGMRPKLLITGCLDSDFSGLLLARKLKEIVPALKIIIITGYPKSRVEWALSRITLKPDFLLAKDGLDFMKLAATAGALLSIEGPTG